MSGPGFRLERRNARLLVNSKPVMTPPACSVRSMIGRKSFTFSVSSHLFCAAGRSSANGQCVEVARLDEVVAVRDSKNSDGPKLVLTRQEWATFITGLKNPGSIHS
jgi:hypothetical protein